MKKFFIPIAILSLIFTFAGCNPDGDTTPGGIIPKGTISVHVMTDSSALTEIADNSKGFTFPDTYFNRSSEVTIVIQNTGTGDLKLTGSPYVKLDGATAVFAVSSPPQTSTVKSGSSVSFRIKFTPVNATENYVYVTIPNDSENAPDFTFTVYGAGSSPKPIVQIFFDDTEISQNGTINAGEVLITQSEDITVVIRNTGVLPLTISTENITITGTGESAFAKLTNPGGSIPVGEQSQFIIRCAPAEAGVNQAVLTIPTNDNSRNPVIVLLTVTGIRGAAVLELKQGDDNIENNSIVPFDFGNVDLGDSKPLMFTIKNTGNINLELTGNPAVESSSGIFTVLTQPANKTINPGLEVSFLLQYTPTAETEETGVITILNNSDDMIFTLNVKGSGYVKKPQITVRQGNTVIAPGGEYDFGTVPFGEPKDVTFTIGNTGDANLNFVTVDGNRINMENNTGDLFTVTFQPSAVTTVAPDSTTTFTIRLNPTSAGSSYNAIVQIKTNSRDNDEFSFTVKGRSVLAAPSGVTAVFQVPGSILLSWNPVTGATGYKVYYGTSSSAITILADSAVTETSYTHTGLMDGTTYYYCIKAQDDVNESGFSQAVSRITLPGIPANLRSTASTPNSITLAWNTATGAASYNVYFATSADGSKTLVGTVNSGTTYTHTDLPPNTTYFYFVSAMNSSGEGAYTENLAARTLLAPLSPPVNVTATALSTNSIQVIWDAVSGAANYKVYRATSANGTRTLLDTVAATSFTSGGLEAITYWYFVTSINADNIESALSAYASMIPMPGVPSAVGTWAFGYPRVEVSWVAVSGAEGYRIYYATSPTGTKTLAGTALFSDLWGNWKFYHDGVATNTTYYYWVTAFNAGGESDYSLYSSILTPPAAPTNLRVTATTATSITIAWNAVTGAASYYISGVTPPTTTGTTYVISGCSPQTWYTFEVHAVNSAGTWGPAAEISVRTN